ncbi:MAG: hypothetical protein AAB305_02940 [Candidatus Zixiibacteriota bacterium]
MNILSTTMLVIASIYAMAAFPWMTTGGMDLAVGVAIVLNAASPMRAKC